MTWDKFDAGGSNQTWTSSCGRYKILRAFWSRVLYTLFVDGKYARGFHGLKNTQKNATRLAETGRFIGGSLPDYTLNTAPEIH